MKDNSAEFAAIYGFEYLEDAGILGKSVHGKGFTLKNAIAIQPTPRTAANGRTYGCDLTAALTTPLPL